MKRTAFLRKPPDVDTLVVKVLRTRKCAVKGCTVRFTPRNMAHKACGPEHAVIVGAAAKAQAERMSDRARREAVKTRGDHIADTQVAFNKFIRLRDQLAGHLCISSGLPLDWSGNNVDAGHYRSRGSAPHLRFDERNVHAQSKRENRYASGNATDYRIGLIARIGLAEVEALERDQAPRHWSIDELKAIKAEYIAKYRQMQREKS